MHISGNHHVCGGHNFLYFIFALVSEEPSPQCMCNVCTIQQHISSSEMELGLNLWPVTQPNPTRTLFDPVNRPGHWEPGALNWEIILMTVCYKWMLCAKSLVHAAHTQMTKISNIIVSLFSTENWKVKTRNSAIADKPRDAFRGQSRSPNMVPC